MPLKENLHYGANPNTIIKSKELRQRMTPAEKVLWKYVRNNKTGDKFRRQHPINIFIADFYCHEKKLVVEVDGGIHNLPEQKDYDIGKALEFERFGIKVPRYTNDEIMKYPEAVVEDILKVLKER
jgi:very-short-patch-repair endonuclease